MPAAQVDRERLLEHSQEKRCNKVPYGTCKVSYNDSRVMQSIYGAIQEYAGFARPEWLD